MDLLSAKMTTTTATTTVGLLLLIFLFAVEWSTVEVSGVKRERVTIHVHGGVCETPRRREREITKKTLFEYASTSRAVGIGNGIDEIEVSDDAKFQFQFQFQKKKEEEEEEKEKEEKEKEEEKSVAEIIKSVADRFADMGNGKDMVNGSFADMVTKERFAVEGFEGFEVGEEVEVACTFTIEELLDERSKPLKGKPLKEGIIVYNKEDQPVAVEGFEGKAEVEGNLYVHLSEMLGPEGGLFSHKNNIIMRMMRRKGSQGIWSQGRIWKGIRLGTGIQAILMLGIGRIEESNNPMTVFVKKIGIEKIGGKSSKTVVESPGLFAFA